MPSLIKKEIADRVQATPKGSAQPPCCKSETRRFTPQFGCILGTRTGEGKMRIMSAAIVAGIIGMSAASGFAAEPPQPQPPACPPLPGGALCQAATVLPQLAKGITDMTDAFTHIVGQGSKAIKVIAALVDQNKLNKLAIQLSEKNVYNDQLLVYLKDYQRHGGRSPGVDWYTVVNHASITLKHAMEVQESLKEMPSNLVNEKVYDDLRRQIGLKGQVLLALNHINPPSKNDPHLRTLINSFSDYSKKIAKSSRTVQEFNKKLRESDSKANVDGPRSEVKRRPS
jgi:hypothetical protein